MIKYLLAVLLASTSFAGLPPTTLSGQGSTPATTFKFRTPPGQTTQVSGVESLIETGNTNILSNAGFEGTTGWTASGGTFTYSATNPLSGAKSGVWDSDSAAQTLTGSAITVPDGLKDQEGFATCRIKTASGTATHTMAIYDGSTNLFTTNVRSSTAAELSSIKFKFPASGTVTLRFTSVNADEPSIQIDSCFIGPPSGTAVVDLNFLRLGTAWNDQGSNNSNAEASTGQFATYADTAGSTPVDMTGGSATNLTFSRTTTAGEVLNGQASFKVVKAAANAQGEGVSTTLNVPPAYSGKRALIKIPYRVTSGSVVQGDIKVFIHDVTNSVLITPFNNDLVGSNGTISAMFDIPNSTANVQMRVGFHFASTTTTAVTFVFDDASVSPLDLPVGGVVSAIQRLPLTASNTQGFGTPSDDEVFWFQNGPTIHMFGRFASGTATGVEARINLPPGYVAANDFTNIKTVGAYVFNSASSTVINSSMLSEPNVNYLTMGYQNSGTTPLSKQTANTLFGSGDVISFYAEVPVQSVGQATITQSSTFLISSVLATGTRVTSTPTKLGEWQSQLRNAAANTFTDTNGIPGTLPSVTNGIRIYRGNAYASADTNNEPSHYLIFIGKNKNYQMLWYNTSGRTGLLDARGTSVSTNDIGWLTAYDPTTGILSLTRPVTGGTAHYAGLGEDAGFSSNDPYFDVIISESAAPMAIIAPNSSVIFDTGVNANGSTNTTVRRFTNVTTSGSALTASQSTTLGDSVTVNERGTYTISYTDVATGSTSNYAAITVNGTALTTDPSALTYAQGFRAGSYNPSDEMWFVGSVTLQLNVGDIIRFQRTNARLSTSSRVIGVVTQVSKGG